MKNRGFTLIELLIVVAIIAVLMAILLPSLAAARTQAGSVACLSNLRQLSMADQMYLSESGKYHVPVVMGEIGRWYNNPLFRSSMGLSDNIPAGYRRGMLCAQSYAIIRQVTINTPSYYQINLSYGQNCQGLDLGVTGSRPEFAGFSNSNVARPSSTILFADAVDWGIKPSYNPPLPGYLVGSAGVYAVSGLGEAIVDMGSKGNVVAYRHGGKMNVVCFDGHGESWTYPQVLNTATDKVRCFNCSIFNVFE